MSVEQSTSCCSERPVKPVPADAVGPGSAPVAMNAAPSRAPVAANAQQLPHPPWSLTGVTAPAATQFTDDCSARAASSLRVCSARCAAVSAVNRACSDGSAIAFNSSSRLRETLTTSSVASIALAMNKTNSVFFYSAPNCRKLPKRVPDLSNRKKSYCVRVPS